MTVVITISHRELAIMNSGVGDITLVRYYVLTVVNTTILLFNCINIEILVAIQPLTKVFMKLILWRTIKSDKFSLKLSKHYYTTVLMFLLALTSTARFLMYCLLQSGGVDIAFMIASAKSDVESWLKVEYGRRPRTWGTMYRCDYVSEYVNYDNYGIPSFFHRT